MTIVLVILNLPSHKAQGLLSSINVYINLAYIRLVCHIGYQIEWFNLSRKGKYSYDFIETQSSQHKYIHSLGSIIQTKCKFTARLTIQ